MPRPRTDAAIEAEVYRKAVNYPRLGATLIHREIIGEGNLPAVRTIGDMIARARALPPAEQLRYREVRWPESFGTADLPWESAAAVIELARSIGRPPLVPLAVWYWRASLALPGAGFIEQRRRLAAHAALGDSQPNRTEVFTSIHARIVSGDIPSGVHGDEPGATDVLMDAVADELLRRAAKGVEIRDRVLRTDGQILADSYDTSDGEDGTWGTLAVLTIGEEEPDESQG